MNESITALGQEQSSLRAQVFLALTDAVVVTDLEGRIIDCNPAAEAMFATTRDDMLGQLPSELGRGPGDRRRPDGPVPAIEIRAALNQDGYWRGDVWLPAAHAGAGTLSRPRAASPDLDHLHTHAGQDELAETGRSCHRVGSAHLFTVLGLDGKRVGHAGVIRDVTDQRRLAQGLARAEQRWRSMLDVAPIGLAIVSLQGKFILANAALSRIIGYPVARLTELTIQRITHPQDLADDLALINQLIGGQIDHYTLPKRYLHADGHYVWSQLSVALVKEPHGNSPEQFVVAIEDITAERLASDRLTSIIAGASDAFIAIATAGYVTEWNTSAEQLFGYTRNQALGQSLAQLIIPAELRHAHHAGLERMRRGEPGRILGHRIEVTAQTRTGQKIPVELTVWHSGEGGNEFYAFVHDISARALATRRQSEIAAAQLAIAQVELSARKVMEAVCEHAQRLTGADGASVELREGSEMVAAAVTGAAVECLGFRVPIDDSLSGTTVTGQEALICFDTETDPRVNLAAAHSTRARSMVLAPLHRGSEVYGVVKVMSYEPHRFTDDDRSTLALLAAPVGAAMSNA